MSDDIQFRGPHVGAALICEKVLLEQGNVPTFVRVVDRFTVPVFSQPIPDGVQVPQGIQANLVVLVKAGDIGAGRHSVTIKLQKPDGSYAPEQKAQIFFQGSQENGSMLHVPIAIANPEEGLHWFEILFDEVTVLSRIPMRVLFQPTLFPQAQTADRKSVV